MKSTNLDLADTHPVLVLVEPEAQTQVASVVTPMVFHRPASEVWDGLMFYEQIRSRPPILLRLLLPTPLCTEGGKPEVGQQVRCLYATGHLVKAVTHIDRGHKLAFRVIEQKIAFGGGIKLIGGHYALVPRPDGTTQVILSTEYIGFRRPRWFWKPLEAAICHAFHRFILRQMRQQGRSGSNPGA